MCWVKEQIEKAHTVGFHLREVRGKAKPTMEKEIETGAGSEEKDVQQLAHVGVRQLLEDGRVLLGCDVQIVRMG